MPMSDRERFLFDLQGFLIVPGLLTPDEVGALNEAIDAHHDRAVVDRNDATRGSVRLAGTGKRQLLSGMLSWDHPWCDPFRALLAHRRLVPYLNALLGPGWKSDHTPALFMAQPGAQGLVLHGTGACVLDPALNYTFTNGQSRAGLLSIEFHLVDSAEGNGGFAAIPGSHKANYLPPEDVLRCDDVEQLAVNPAMGAGDMLIFTEAVFHGTLPWRAEHERRSLLYRYTPGYMHYAGGAYKTSMPSWADELTPEQRAVLQPPGVYGRPVFDDEGRLVSP